MIPKLYPPIAIGMKLSSENSITNFLCGSVGSLNICIPKFRHWFGFISDFTILFTNHRLFPNSSITNYPKLSSNSVPPMKIGIFTCSLYYRRNGDKLHSSKVNDISQNPPPTKMGISMIFHFSG